MKSRQKPAMLLITLGLLALLLLSPACITGLMVYRQQRQQRLDRALIAEIEAGDTPSVISLLHAGADPNATEDVRPPIPSWRRLADLIQVRKRVQDTHRSHHTALWLAVHYAGSDLATVNALLRQGAGVYDRDGRFLVPLSLRTQLQRLNQAFLDAVRRDFHPGILVRRDDGVLAVTLLCAGADPNLRDERHATPLILAAQGWVRCRSLMIHWLCERGADVNATDDRGDTALAACAAMNDLPDVEYLLRKGARLNAAVRSSENPLFLPCQNGLLDMVKMLLKAGADVNLVSGYEKRTPLMGAASESGDETQNVTIMHLLVEHGARVNAVDRNHRSALTWAAQDGSMEAVNLLIEHDADLKIRSDDNVTLIQRARDTDNPGRFKVIAVLKLAGSAE